MFKSGFVNIIGKPNVGKSTLMNALVGEKMSIITPKPQTTRHRILGILSGENFQLIFFKIPDFKKLFFLRLKIRLQIINEKYNVKDIEHM